MQLPDWIQNTGIIAGIVAAIGTIYQAFINQDLKKQNSILGEKVAVMQTQTMHLEKQANELEKQSGQFEIQSKLMEKHYQALEAVLKDLQNEQASSSVNEEKKLKLMERKRRVEIQPWFQGIPSSNPSQVNISFTNEGESAKNFKYSTTSKRLNFSNEETISPIKKGDRIAITGYPAVESINCNIEEFELEIRYSDIDGNIYKQTFHRSADSKRTSEPELIAEVGS